MKPEELRIGNLISYGGEVEKVKELHLFKLATSWFNIEYEKCEPIPLSPEWLVRLGALKEISKEGWRYAIGHMDYSYVLEHRNDFGFTDGGYFMGIRYDDWDADPITINRFAYLKNGLQYVHQLQNLFQALTGEELTLKP